MAFRHQGRVEVACNLDTVVEPGDSVGHHTPPETVERRVAELAGRHAVSLLPTSRIIGFTREGAAQAAWDALSRGDGEAWKHRDRTSM